jgi:adenine-specific DNA-methyltransferase
MNNKQKLELTWIGKENEPKLEPRILIEDPEKSYGDKNSQNMLIHGDNLLALKALEQDFTGKVKCVFIDPPYNTGSAFTHYDDGLEHSLWLTMMRDRLALIKHLISDDGSLWITIDDTEGHYLKILCDEVFGRMNFVANVIWQKRFAPNSTAQFISDSHDHVLVYAKEKPKWKRNLLPREEKHDKNYKNLDNDPRGPWTSGDLSARNAYSAGIYPVETPSGRVIPGPPKGMYWRVSQENMLKLDKDNRIWWGVNKSNVPRLKRFLSEVMEGIVPQTIWLQDEVGHTQEAKKEVMASVPSDAEVFQTPKPERLLKRVFDIASNPDDIILDSFLGSGTTAAVAHKMGRRWIGIELGDHCYTHCVPRMKQVCDGTDQGGISKAVNWTGGGGFKFYELAPSLLKKDKYDNWVIDERYNADMLAAAMAKHEGFRYNPSPELYWKQGQSTEKDFIFTTTIMITLAILDRIHDEMKEDESLLICTRSFQKACENKYPSINIKKIPNMLLGRCEFGREDYSMNIIDMPREDEPDFVPVGPGENKKAKKEKKKDEAQTMLF